MGFMAIWIFCLIFCFGVGDIEGSVHEYHNRKFNQWGNGYAAFGGSEGLYESAPDAEGQGIANGLSYIRFDTTFTRTNESAHRHDVMEHSTGLVEAIIFELREQEKIGGVNSSGHPILCCTPEIAEEMGCRTGEIIVHPEDGWPKLIKVSFRGNQTLARLSDETVNITRNGMYTLYFVFCEPQLKDLTLNGKTMWKNPSGYLPGRMGPLMKFYGLFSLAYLLLGLLWLVQYLRFWKDILQLQNCISAVIFLGHAEMALWYFEYANFNATGQRPIGLTTWAVTFAAIRKTISRLVILIVSMGYGVVRPTLGGLSMKVMLLGATYFLAAETLDMMENVGRIDDLSEKAHILLVLPDAILDAVFVVWIFTSLSKTLEKLQARKQHAKLELYRKFTNALAISVVISIIWIGYELYFRETNSFNLRWQSAWMVPAFWNILSFGILCVLCALWAPSQNSTRYAYSEEVGDDGEDEESVSLTGGKGALELEKIPGKQEKKERKLGTTDMFSLEDVEEDKRE